MHRFIKTDASSDASRREQSERSHDSAGLVGQDVAEHVLGEDDVEFGGLEDERHGGRVHIHVRKLDIGKIAGDASYDFTPKPRALQNIRLIDREQALAAGLSELKGDAGNALDLRFAIAHGVDRLACAGSAFDGARLAEIQSAEQFAHDEDVGSLDDFLAQWRTGSKRGIKSGRTEIGESPELLSQAQESSFGTRSEEHT